jgi:glucose-1-phosphate cytidylyltransferase
MQIDNNLVSHFGEKNQSDEGWINGGFFVLEPEVADLVHGNSEPFESGALPRLVKDGQLMAYQHEDFWQPMDTLREKQELSKYAQQSPPPWLQGII